MKMRWWWVWDYEMYKLVALTGLLSNWYSFYLYSSYSLLSNGFKLSAVPNVHMFRMCHSWRFQFVFHFLIFNWPSILKWNINLWILLIKIDNTNKLWFFSEKKISMLDKRVIAKQFIHIPWAFKGQI